jgi:signal transduction histidine kinase
MLTSILYKNWDLLVLGIVIIATAIVGFIVYFQKPKSPTHSSFLGFALATAIWGTCSYLSYHIQPASTAFYFLRLTIFSVVWQTFYFLRFSLIFPKEEKVPQDKVAWSLLGTTILVSILTLTSLVFERIESVSASGAISQVVNGPAVPLFGMVSVGFTLAGLIILLKKTLIVKGEYTKPYRLISIGALVMFGLIIASNFILPVFFGNANYIPFGVLFVFPFIALTSYAIIKGKVFNVKVISAEFFITLLAALSLLQLVQSQELVETLLRAGIFICVLAVGILLIKSILREVEQREELERLNKQIEEKNAQLEDLSHFKSQLLSLASHQIKSPLAAIKGFVSLILDGSYGETGDKVKETLGKVQRSADDLIGLINTLLDVRKVEEGKMEYKFERTDLNKMIGDMVELLKPLAQVKQLEFSFASPGHEVWVNADPEKLKQVVQNLADNAIKYTPSGFVKMELKEMPAGGATSVGSAVVFVSDSGLGIAPELVPHLFEEFVRDERVKKAIRGTGLGLFIARKIAEAHGGTISATSPGEGKGSTFQLTLPEIK